MPATINGTPTHVLIVHAVVVLLPLSIVAALALVFIPRTRKAFGVLSVGIALVGCLAVPLAFMTGGDLRGMVPPSPLIDHHVAMAHQLAFAAAVFGLALAAFVAIDVRRRASGTDELNQVESFVVRRYLVGWSRENTAAATATKVAAGVLVVLSVLTTIAVVRAGDSGAKAAWSNRIATAQGSH